jgi:hypothetical protein
MFANARLRAACELLTASMLSVKEVAARLSYTYLSADNTDLKWLVLRTSDYDERNQ